MPCIPRWRFPMRGSARKRRGQLGINQDVPAADLARALKNRLRYKDDSLAELLQQIENALHNPELREAEALELAQQLNRHAQGVHAHNPKLNPMERQETDLHANRVPGAHHGRTELAKVIVGQQELINQSLLTILCGGHALLEGVPGIAKTLVIKSLCPAV